MKFLVKGKKDKKDKKVEKEKKEFRDFDKEFEEYEYSRLIIDVFQNLQATGDASWLKLLPENFLKR